MIAHAHQILFFIKYIRVFHPAGQPLAVQISSRLICASPLKCLEHFRTALAGRAAINLRDEIYKEKYPKERRPAYLPLILNDKLPVQYRIWSASRLWHPRQYAPCIALICPSMNKCVALIPASMQPLAANTKKSSLIFSLINLKFKAINGGNRRA